MPRRRDQREKLREVHREVTRREVHIQLSVSSDDEEAPATVTKPRAGSSKRERDGNGGVRRFDAASDVEGKKKSKHNDIPFPQRIQHFAKSVLVAVGNSSSDVVSSFRVELRNRLATLAERAVAHGNTIDELLELEAEVTRYHDHCVALESKSNKLDVALAELEHKRGKVQESLARVEWVNEQLRRLASSNVSANVPQNAPTLAGIVASAQRPQDAKICLQAALVRLNELVAAFDGVEFAGKKSKSN
jgi:hypothetical protein